MCKLIAKTKHAKEILKRWASGEAFIYQENNKVFFTNEVGPWLLILPENSMSDTTWRHAK